MNASAQSQILAFSTFGIQPLSASEYQTITGGDNTATVSVPAGPLTMPHNPPHGPISTPPPIHLPCDNA